MIYIDLQCMVNKKPWEFTHITFCDSLLMDWRPSPFLMPLLTIEYPGATSSKSSVSKSLGSVGGVEASGDVNPCDPNGKMV